MGYGQSSVHNNATLSNFAIRYMQSRENFIADRVYKPMPVKKSSDKYFIFDTGHWRIKDDLRGPTSEANRVKSSALSTDTYSIQKYAYYDLVSNEEIADADSPLTPVQDLTADLTQTLMIAKEKRIADAVNLTAAASNYTSLAAASQWSYTSTTTPIDDVDTGNFTLEQAVGQKGNLAVTSNDVWKVLKRHGQITDLIKYVNPNVGNMTPALIAGVLDIDELIIGKGIFNNQGEGISTNIDYIWANNFWILYQPTGPAGGKTLAYAKLFYNSNNLINVYTSDEPKKHSQRVEVETGYDPKITAASCAYIIFGAVA